MALDFGLLDFGYGLWKKGLVRKSADPRERALGNWESGILKEPSGVELKEICTLRILSRGGPFKSKPWAG